MTGDQFEATLAATRANVETHFPFGDTSLTAGVTENLQPKPRGRKPSSGKYTPERLRQRREAHQRWKERNPEKARESVRASYYRHAEKRRQSSQMWAALNPEARKAAVARWRVANQEHEREYRKASRAKRDEIAKDLERTRQRISYWTARGDMQRVEQEREDFLDRKMDILAMRDPVIRAGREAKGNQG